VHLRGSSQLHAYEGTHPGAPLDRARALDLALLLPTLPLFLPAIGALALTARLAQGGPVWFLQERVGRGGRTFRVYKIRTMTTEPAPTQRTVTPLGAWLRLRGLDELPQLLNVLKGDMRLVGPRPLTPADFDRLSAAHARFAERARVRPGLTGIAQACQSQGIAQTAALEAGYATHRSALLDVRILLRTAWMNVVGKRRGRWSAVAWEARLA
jgi:lipopolysaccharide/colanic/teichoic acid biosynthesis glycosyltransferase